jgi:hypothetical protein
MMRIAPASKVSVPVVVVRRILSIAPDNVTTPAVTTATVLALLKVPLETHVLPDSKVRTKWPLIVLVAVPLKMPNPLVKLKAETNAPACNAAESET